MDPLTHALVGGVSAKTIHASKCRFWIMVILGLTPDLDLIANLFGPWAAPFQHRGLTHSFIGVGGQTFFWAWVLKSIDKGPFGKRLLHYSFPLTLHLLGDTLTGFGCPLLAPFGYKEYSADLVVGLALIPIFFMGFGLLWCYRNKKIGWKATRPIWISWLVYLMLTYSGKAYASYLIQGPTYYQTTLPTTYNPFIWRAIEIDNQYHLYRQLKVNLLKGRTEVVQTFDQPSPDPFILFSMESSLVKTFLKENRWPVVRKHRIPSGWMVEWGNLLFSMRGHVRSKVRIYVNNGGNIVKEEKSFGFWNPKT